MDKELYDILQDGIDQLFTDVRDLWGEPLNEIEVSEAKSLFLAELERHTEGYEGM